MANYSKCDKLISPTTKGKQMDNAIFDREMVHVILNAFHIASNEAMSSLIANPSKPLKEKPTGFKFAEAEIRVLETLNELYPDIVAQYFNINRQR